MRGIRRAAAALVLLAAGCATASLGPAEEDSLLEVQAFADAIVRTYQIRPVRIVHGETTVFWGDFGVMNVNRAILTAPLPIRDASIARLLAFAVLQPPTPQSAPDEAEINRRLYPERNAVAVDILTRVKGLPRAIAVGSVLAFIEAQARAVAEKRLAVPERVPHPCDERRWFVERFEVSERSSWCP